MDDRPKLLVSAILPCIIVITVQLGIAAGVIWYFPDWPSRGQFGDLFGAANALFSGLAFAGLVYTVVLQQRQIAAQRREFASIQKEASATLAAQARANNLNLLSLLGSHYEAQLAQLEGRKVDGPSGAQLTNLRIELTSRRARVLRIVEALHSELEDYFGGQNVR